jgi:hypothetical protein
VHLMPAVEDIDPLLDGDRQIAIEISASLLELSKILDRLERALRPE